MLSCGHGGNIRGLAKSVGRRERDLADFSANINPLGPPSWLHSLINSQLGNLVHYPDAHASLLVEALAVHYGVSVEEVIVGNGSTEILYLLPNVLGKNGAVVPVPSYVDYLKVAQLAGLSIQRVFLRETEGFRLEFSALEPLLHGDELVFLGQPNNPTGFVFDAQALRLLAQRHAETIFIVDEAFADFIDGMDRLTSNRPPNVIVLCSHTKFYAIPGLRLGCAIAHEQLARGLRGRMPPWSVNTLAQAVGEKAVQDSDFAVRSRVTVRKLREGLYDELRSIPDLTVYPGEANFFLVRIDGSKPDAVKLARCMLNDGIAIRICTNFEGLDARFFRVAVRTEEENARLCKSLRKAFHGSFR